MEPELFLPALRDTIMELLGPIVLVLTGITLGLIAWLKGRAK